ncbi:hypothetical protein Adt_30534 [Abeliophyllum distichum]|uniref:Uncharacterized protein n=1 Tax=Abeliophyllum distichum TaxID=126358 RepID=A0ABD1RBI7_9LAMI
MEHSFAQVPLPLRLGHLAACSSHGAQLRSRASPTGIRPPCSRLLSWSTASLNGLSHWDSATLQLAAPMEYSFAQGLLSLELFHLAAGSSHGAQLRSRASPTGRPPCNLLLPRSIDSLKGLSHWDSSTLQQAPPMEHNFTQVPLLLGLGQWQLAPTMKHSFDQVHLPLGLCHLAACSFHGA